MNTRCLVLFLLGSSLLPATQYPSYPVLKMGFAPVIYPDLPACGSSQWHITQTDQQQYQLQCVSALGATVMKNAYVYQSGMGACPGSNLNGLQNYCQATSIGNGTAPLFQPGFNAIYMGWSIYVTSDSVDYIPGVIPFTYTCGNETVAATTPPNVEKYPSCPTYTGVSPIVIDVTGEGFWMTDNAHGVKFRSASATPLRQMSWTDPAHRNAWLVRPNADGSVTSIADNMFGNLSPQPPSAEPNGYSALGYAIEQAGCASVSRLDSTNCPAVWSTLRLWQDANQDGVAQPEELRTLMELGIYAISLQYHASPRTDQYGNQFRYASHIWDANGTDHDNRTYDVFLLLQ